MIKTLKPLAGLGENQKHFNRFSWCLLLAGSRQLGLDFDDKRTSTTNANCETGPHSGDIRRPKMALRKGHGTNRQVAIMFFMSRKRRRHHSKDGGCP